MGSQSGWSLSVSVQQTLQWGDTEAKALSNNKHCLGLKVSSRDLSGQLTNWVAFLCHSCTIATQEGWGDSSVSKDLAWQAGRPDCDPRTHLKISWMWWCIIPGPRRRRQRREALCSLASQPSLIHESLIKWRNSGSKNRADGILRKDTRG